MRNKWMLLRLAPLLPFAVVLLPLLALARGGGGQHYSSGRSDNDSSGNSSGSGGDSSGIVWALPLLLPLESLSLRPLE